MSSFAVKNLLCVVPCLLFLSWMRTSVQDDDPVAHVDLLVHENHVEIYLASQREIAGFQFTVKDGHDEPLVVKQAKGGRSADLGLSVQHGKNGIVLGYSLTGTRIPPSDVGGKHHEYILTNLDLIHPVPSTMQLCLKDVILAGPGGEALPVGVPECSTRADKGSKTFKQFLRKWNVNHSSL